MISYKIYYKKYHLVLDDYFSSYTRFTYIYICNNKVLMDEVFSPCESYTEPLWSWDWAINPKFTSPCLACFRNRTIDPRNCIIYFIFTTLSLHSAIRVSLKILIESNINCIFLITKRSSSITCLHFIKLNSPSFLRSFLAIELILQIFKTFRIKNKNGKSCMN